MPVYNFINKLGELEQHTLSYNDLEEFKTNNPDLQYTLSTPSFIGGVSNDSGRLPEGFKDRMRLLKQKNPLSKAVDHLI
jgi:hypothetical protein|tara:strand:- start:507 stop:743 length:237 start_codon:yes stop_codon:yes gene_type:complete